MVDIIENKLGDRGSILTVYKVKYRKTHPDNLIIFNSSIIVNDEKIWYGDIDLTESKDSLIELSKTINNNIYVLFGPDKRLHNENILDINNFVMVYSPDGTYKLNQRLVKYFNI